MDQPRSGRFGPLVALAVLLITSPLIDVSPLLYLLGRLTLKSGRHATLTRDEEHQRGSLTALYARLGYPGPTFLTARRGVEWALYRVAQISAGPEAVQCIGWK